MMIEPAPAKLNLALHVRRRRADGYHDIETLFAFCRDGDLLTIEPAHEDSFAIEGPFAGGLDAGADNLVTRARDAFRTAFKGQARYAITLDKRLPIASGIGGGSADAGAVLRALARRGGVAIDDPKLVRLAAELGADVPACLLGESARGEGRGERLVPLEGPAGLPVLLVNPLVEVPTGAVFAAWDGEDKGALHDGDAMMVALAGRNDLEPPARAIAPVIGDVLSALGRREGVRLARMSGSGATCFAIFENVEARDRADAVLAKKHNDWWRLPTTLA